MSITFKVTNLTTSTVSLTDLYTTIGSSAGDEPSVTVTRSMSEIDRMLALKALVAAGTVAVDFLNSSDNADAMSVPMEQHGVISQVSVISATVVTPTAVTFGTAFHSAVVPLMHLTVVQNARATTFKATPYVRSLSNTAFTLALDVTTAQTNAITTEAQTTTPAQNGVLLGPFTSTLAHPPITAAAITLHWLESTVAKTATITGASTLGGANAANLASGSIDRTSGLLTLTFAGGHPPDVASITVDYAEQLSCDVHWSATY